MARIVAVVGFVGAVFGGAQPTAAQMGNASVGRSGNFQNITRLGSFNSRLWAGQSNYSAYSTAQGNYANSRSPLASYGGRSRGASNAAAGYYGRGTRSLLNSRGRRLIQPLGRSPSANLFARPTFTGYAGYVPRGVPQFNNRSTQELAIRPQILAIEQSYYHRALLPLEGGSIRDELTTESLANTPPLPDDLNATQASGRTYAAIIVGKLDAMKAKFLAEGWVHLRPSTDEQGKTRPRDVIRAGQAFDNALAVDPDNLHARIGKFLCAVAEGEEATSAVMLTLLADHNDDMFSVEYPLAKTFGNASVGEGALAAVAATARERPDDDAPLALRAYLLWLDGKRDSAMEVAGELRSRFRSSPYASFLPRMRAQIDADNAAAQIANNDPLGSPQPGSIDE